MRRFAEDMNYEKMEGFYFHLRVHKQQKPILWCHFIFLLNRHTSSTFAVSPCSAYIRQGLKLLLIVNDIFQAVVCVREVVSTEFNNKDIVSSL